MPFRLLIEIVLLSSLHTLYGHEFHTVDIFDEMLKPVTLSSFLMRRRAFMEPEHGMMVTPIASEGSTT